MLPHVVRFNATVVADHYRDLTGRSAEWLADRVSTLVAAAGMPTRLRDLGVTKDVLPRLAEEANGQWTARFNPRPVTAHDTLALYDAAW